MKRKIPNILSLSRVLISPVFYIFFVSGKPNLIHWSLVLFTIGAITDYFDGWFARRMKAMTAWGKFFDPLADKFLTTSAFLAFVSLEIIPLWMVVIIILRDFGTTFLRIFQVAERELQTSRTAKFKTMLQMVFIFAIIIIYSIMQTADTSLRGSLEWFLYSPFVYITMLSITLLTVWSLVEYLLYMFRFTAD